MTRHWSWALVVAGALAMAACGASESPAPTPSLVPEPSTATTPPPTSAPPTSVVTTTEVPPTSETAPPTEADLHVPVLVLPEDFTHETRIEQFHASVVTLDPPATADDDEEGAWDDDDAMSLKMPRFDHPDRAVRAALADRVREDVMQQVMGANDATLSMDCAVHLAHEHLVSATCWMWGSGGREGFTSGAFVLSYAIEGGAIRPVQPQEAIVPSVDLGAVVEAACEERVARDYEADDYSRPDCAYTTIAFGPHGFAASVWSEEGGERVDLSVPYRRLVDQIRVEGPLGAVLPIASQNDVVVTPEQLLDIELAHHCQVGWTLSPPEPIDAVLMRFDRRGPAEPSAVLWRGGLAAAQLAVSFCATDHAALAEDEASASTLASALGGSAVRETDGAAGGAVGRARVTDTLNVRSGPGTRNAIVRTLSPGTDVIFALGIIGGSNFSSLAGRGTWVRIVASEGTEGWVSSAFVRRVTECARPDLAAFLAGLPEPARADAARDAMRGMATAPSAMRFVLARSAVAGRSWVATFAESDCALATPLHVYEVDGRVEEVQFVPAARGSTEAVVVIGASRLGPADPGFDGTMRWSAFAPGVTTAGWSAEVTSHYTLPSAQRTSVSFGVRSGPTDWQIELRAPHGAPRRVRWDAASAAFVDTAP